ncbi:MAG: hypothetical protein ACREMQ_12595, partial [Longimicrobiales bacterium]
VAWISGDRFLAVHDAKNPEENARPRVSLVSVPSSPAGPIWESLHVDWPTPLGMSSDLESIARIPGTYSFLLVESGEGMAVGHQFRRIFHVRLEGSRLSVVSFTDLPRTVQNIEGAAVAQVGDQLVFVFSERAEGMAATDLAWAPLRLEPLELGAVQQVRFAPNGVGQPGWRPVSAIEIDNAGRILIASAFDPGDDNGPFQSAIWLAGRVAAGSSGSVVVVNESPVLISRLDGFKVEALALRPAADGEHFFAGTDDENHGGNLRQIPLARPLTALSAIR